LKRKGSNAQILFINNLDQGLFTIFDLTTNSTSRIAQLMKQYENLPMDLADASLVILAEHLGHGRIFSVDQRDFNTYRWKQNSPFENLLSII
jgi:predicted nucleic acid-binding protein